MSILSHMGIGYSVYNVAFIIGCIIVLVDIAIFVGEYVPVVDTQRLYGIGNGLLMVIMNL